LNDFKEELYAYVGRIAKGETKIKTENPYKKKSGKIIYFPEYRWYYCCI